MLTKKELTIIERAAFALSSSDCEKSLIALAAESKGITIITNADGRAQCHASAMKATKARTGISATGKASRDDANAFSKAVIAEEKRLIEIIEPEEIRLKKLRDEWDAKIEAEKAEKARIEQERYERIKLLIDDMRDYPSQCVGFSWVELTDAKCLLDSRDVSDSDFAERTDEANYFKQKAIQKIEEMRVAKLAQEQAEAKAEADRIEAAAELEAETARNREQAAALADRERVIADQIAAIKAHNDALAAAEAAKLADAERVAREVEDARVSEELRVEREASMVHAEIVVNTDVSDVKVEKMADVGSGLADDEDSANRLVIIEMTALGFGLSFQGAESLLIKLFGNVEQ